MNTLQSGHLHIGMQNDSENPLLIKPEHHEYTLGQPNLDSLLDIDLYKNFPYPPKSSEKGLGIIFRCLEKGLFCELNKDPIKPNADPFSETGSDDEEGVFLSINGLVFPQKIHPAKKGIIPALHKIIQKKQKLPENPLEIPSLQNAFYNYVNSSNQIESKKIEKFNFEPLLQHQQFADKFLKPRISFTLTETQYSELSEQYTQLIRSMPKTISLQELRVIAELLRIGPLLTAALSLGKVLADKTQMPSRDLKLKNSQLISCYEAMNVQDHPFAQLMNSSLSDVSVSIYDAEKQSVSDLDQMLSNAGTCNARTGAANPFAKDAKIGGSIHFQVKGSRGYSYNRIYLAISNGKPILFHDCIESQDLCMQKLSEYVNIGKEDQLLASFAATIAIANSLGLETVAVADYEFVDLARSLGFGERKIFGDSSNSGEKLGYSGDHYSYDGVPMWRMGHDKTFRAFNPQLYQESVLNLVISQAYDVMQRVDQKNKIAIALNQDLSTYFGIVKHILLDRKFSGETLTRFHDDLDAFCQKYSIHPESVIQTQHQAYARAS